MKRVYISTLVSMVAGVAAVGLIAGCSSNSGSSPSAAVATTTSAAAGGFTAYAQCLTEHGVTLPSRGAFGGGQRSPGAGFTPRARPSGGYGGFGLNPSANPTVAAAVQACAPLRPTGGAGFRGGFGGGTRLAAFRNCMSQQGEALPTTRPTARPTALPTGEARYLAGLNTSDPKVQAALKVCEPLIPTTAPTAPTAPTG